MSVSLQPILSDVNLDLNVASSQRQLSLSISALSETSPSLPLNLCLILDRSGSMGGRALEMVKAAAGQLVDRLKPGDRLSVVTFDHQAGVIIPNQLIENSQKIKQQINKLRSGGGTSIDEGLKLGIEELGKGKKETVSQAFLLTDGENEHGDNQRCLKLAKLAREYNITIHSLGVGENWNQDVLEAIADEGGGTMVYIEKPEEAVLKFASLFERLQSIGLTNAYLLLSLMPQVRLAELKPVAQVFPDTIELPVSQEGERFVVRLGDLMREVERVVLANLYIGKLGEGKQPIAQVQIRYDDPIIGSGLLSPPVIVEGNFVPGYQPMISPQVQQHILSLAKYRQTQIAEYKLQQGDRSGAATMLQTAAKTALQMGDKSGATVLQTSATRLQSGEDLSETDRKKTRIVSKTILQ